MRLNTEKMLSVFLFLLVVVILAACGNEEGTSSTTDSNNAENQESNEAQASEDTIVIKTSHGVPPANIRHLVLEHFGELLNEYTDGRVVLDIYPAGQLYADD